MTRGRRPMAAPPSQTRGAAIRRDRRLLVALVALGTFVLVGAIALGGVGRTPGSPSTSGVAAAAGSFAAEAPVASPSAVPDPGREVYGFVPYWEMDRTIVDHLAGIRATTVALFSVTHAT